MACLLICAVWLIIYIIITHIKMGTLFTGALLGSIVTLLLKWGVDFISEGVKHRRGIHMLVFQEKMQTDKIAMSWYQEALDNYILLLTIVRESGRGTLSGGQFDWGGRLLKRSGGAQRLAQYGRKSCKECKRIS